MGPGQGGMDKGWGNGQEEEHDKGKGKGYEYSKCIFGPAREGYEYIKGKGQKGKGQKGKGQK